MTTAVVAGALATKPGNGGNAWTRLTWLVALERLGFDTCFVERVPSGPAMDEQVEWARAVLAAEAPGVRSVFVGTEGELVRTGGPGHAGAEMLDDADLLLNISGHLPGGALGAARARVSVFLDDDPGYTQVWAEAGKGVPGLADHDLHCTYGLNVGRPGCPVPTVGLTWHPLVPPVLLDRWAMPPAEAGSPFTTVATWRSPFGTLTHGGVVHGGKHQEFRRVLALPDLVDAAFALALDLHPGEVDDIAALAMHGWKVVDAASTVDDAGSYRRWVGASNAEFSAAQGVYVGMGCGWVSDRTAAYLAAGRPAVVQDTGAGSQLPVGEGMLVWHDLDDAVSGVEAVLADPARHAAAARRLAVEHFDATTVAGRVCALAGVRP